MLPMTSVHFGTISTVMWFWLKIDHIGMYFDAWNIQGGNFTPDSKNGPIIV